MGRNRRPKLSDRDDLPYIDAVLLETFRFRPPVPLSIPHSAIKDTVIKGYTVPKGTMIIQNIWACHHDPKLWNHHEKFDPGRFIDGNGKLINVDRVVPFSSGKMKFLSFFFESKVKRGDEIEGQWAEVRRKSRMFRRRLTGMKKDGSRDLLE